MEIGLHRCEWNIPKIAMEIGNKSIHQSLEPRYTLIAFSWTVPSSWRSNFFWLFLPRTSKRKEKWKRKRQNKHLTQKMKRKIGRICKNPFKRTRKHTKKKLGPEGRPEFNCWIDSSLNQKSLKKTSQPLSSFTGSTSKFTLSPTLGSRWQSTARSNTGWPGVDGVDGGRTSYEQIYHQNC